MAIPQFKNVITGIDVDFTGCSVDDLAVTCGVGITAAGQEAWDDVVARAVAEDLVGIEALSGIPGTVADATRDNASAHGQSVSDSVASVRTWDHLGDQQKTFPAVDCEFGDGTSRFQERLPDGRPRYEVLEVKLLVRQGDLTQPLIDGALAEGLGAQPGARVPLARVREHLLDPS
ncbi:hypothetical protein FOJ82_13915 [Tessaracoccus rhinocerotis]|uniref:Uncharacterized protein n=1 Tax=Tessaracoccus rhinocerotis TaxID=1689449 RepID=A0A553JWY8_9ACTN|nr:hypothetical protein [Tessaracoccus rhinocerotis]TRY16956.1 hypothetical protein FOJ82_13915 [Tessaracoccus rhinocerotis]